MSPTNPKQQLRSLLIAGLLPVIAFTIIEEKYGVLWGLVAGMVFGVGEIAFEWFRHKRVSGVTLAGNGLLLTLGVVSLLTQEGIWFKLQPALIEGAFALLLIGSVVWGKPLLVVLMQKQGVFEKVPVEAHGFLRARFAGLTFRVGVFFGLHAAIATWAAFYWSTTAWATLKGLGFTLSLFAYMGLEMLLMRRQARATK